MADYVFLGYSGHGPDSEDAARFFGLIREVGHSLQPPIEVMTLAEDIGPGENIQTALMLRFQGALGAVFHANGSSQNVAFEVGVAASRAVPLLVVERSDVDQGLAGLLMATASEIAFASYDPGDAESWQRLRSSTSDWLKHLRRPTSDALTLDERRSLEKFTTAFYRSLEEGTTGLDNLAQLTARIHVDTINLQLRAPEPSRSIIKETVKTLGTFLMGITTGIGASYLYDLLPHIH